MTKPIKSWLVAMAATSIALTAATASLAAEPEVVTSFIENVQQATSRFESVEAALAEGYIPDPSGMCVSAAAEGLPAEWGSMGLHYIHPDLLGITATMPRVAGEGLHTAWNQPSILLYEPQADGSLVLVGVENLVFEAGWRAAGNTEAPSLLGQTWDYMADDPATPGDEAHGFEPHWDQHVWFRENPSGSLMPFNPAVTCDHHLGGHTH